MSFRENLLHLRATHNITQEQLAMLLGVSRQSVSKWEAGRAYPEMDKLLKLCDLFGCTLDELVTGDLASRPMNKTATITAGKTPQDVTGYDEVMRSFAWRFSVGASVPILGLAFALLLSVLPLVPGIDAQSIAGVIIFISLAIGVAFTLPALSKRKAFQAAHPFVEDFYSDEQKEKARSSKLKGLVTGIVLILAGFSAVLLLQAVQWITSSVFLAFVALGVFSIVYGQLLGSRCNLSAYNSRSLSDMNESQIDALSDERLKTNVQKVKRKNKINRIILLAATVVALVLLFVPFFNAQRWFWLPWLIGGLVCAALNTFQS